jgi:hypothetical protein
MYGTFDEHTHRIEQLIQRVQEDPQRERGSNVYDDDDLNDEQEHMMAVLRHEIADLRETSQQDLRWYQQLLQGADEEEDSAAE